jgi:hypothetical protein
LGGPSKNGSRRSSGNVRRSTVGFTPREIASIIRTCSESGVSKLELDGLTLEFNSGSYQSESSKVAKLVPPAPEPKQLEQPLPDPDAEVEHELATNKELEELNLENLMIEDPLGFEREMERRSRENAENPGRAESII